METKADIQEIVIDGKTYVPKGQEKELSGDLKIVILQRGWVMVGKLERTGSDCKLHKASIVRRWGTTKGLGELAMNGPLKDTVLDKTGGMVEFDYLTVIATIPCEATKWENKL